MFGFRVLWLTLLPGAILGQAGHASAQVVFLDSQRSFEDAPGAFESCAGVPDTNGDITIERIGGP